jgi:DNA-binding transcriptional ArsR family regulator
MTEATPVASPAATTPLPVSEAARVAEMLGAMADPTRLRILTALETVCVPVRAVVEATGLRQPAVSHHLRILRDRGLVIGERRGTHVYYCLAGQQVADALAAARVLAGFGVTQTLR